MIKNILAESSIEECDIDVNALHKALLDMPAEKYLHLYRLMDQKIKASKEIKISEEEQKQNFFTLLTMFSVMNNTGTCHELYTVHDGKEYHGPVYIDGSGGMSDGYGHKVEFR